MPGLSIPERIEINLVITSKRINFAACSGLERVLIAGVAELVDALDLGSSGKSRVGSSPIARTQRGRFCSRTEPSPLRYLLFNFYYGIGSDGAVGGGVEAANGGQAHAVGAGLLRVEVILYGVGAWFQTIYVEVIGSVCGRAVV